MILLNNNHYQAAVHFFAPQNGFSFTANKVIWKKSCDGG